MKRIAPILLACLVAVSCSTTKVLREGEYRLMENHVLLEGESDLSSGTVHSWIVQQPSTSVRGWNPLVSIYNWNGDIWKKVGEPPVVLSEAAVESSCTSIVRRLQTLGYYGSTVSSRIVTKGKKATVEYTVYPGKRYVIDELNFVLPEESEDFVNDFYADTANIAFKVGDYLRQADLAAEASRSANALRRMGYYAINRNSYSFIADTLGRDGHVTLDYVVSEGDMPLDRVTVGEVGISYPKDLKLSRKVLEGMNLVKPGQQYDERLVEYTYNRFSSLKMFSSVAVEMTQNSAESVDCEITLTPSSLQGFKANLEASTNSSGLIGISPQINFFHKNIFGGGEWLNVGFSGNFQFMLGSETRANEFGASMSLSLPRFLGLGYDRFKGPNVPRTEFNASYSYQDRPEYWRNIFSTSMGYSGRLGKLGYQLYPLQFSYVRLYQMSDDFKAILAKNPQLKYSYEDHFDAGLGGYLLHTTSTEAVPKTNYSTTGFRFDLSGNLISLIDSGFKTNSLGQKMILGAPYAQYMRFELSQSGAIRFGEREQFSIAARALAGFGLAYGNSETLPYEKQFYVGGSSSMRGWQARSLGPGSNPMETSFSIPSQTGDLKAELDLELRYPLFWKIEGALFLETGNVWESSQKYSAKQMLESLAADWGLGVRANLDFLLVRVDMGVQLRDPVDSVWYDPITALGRRGFAIHFGVGYPF